MNNKALLIDTGNSFAKVAACEAVFATSAYLSALDDHGPNNWLLRAEPIPNAVFSEQKLNQAISSLGCSAQNVNKVIVSSVRSAKFNEQLSAWLTACFGNLDVEFLRPQKATANVINLYQTIETLGVDRWLSALAAYKLTEKQLLDNAVTSLAYNKNAIVIIGVGTALTIDLVDITRLSESQFSGQYHGGMIIPGAFKMLQSLTTTDNLPEVDSAYMQPQASIDKLFAKTTHDAIASGVAAAMQGAALYARTQLINAGYNILATFYYGGGAASLYQADESNSKQHRQDLQFLGMLIASASYSH